MIRAATYNERVATNRNSHGSVQHTPTAGKNPACIKVKEGDMPLEQLIKLAQSKGYCITIWCWDVDIGYGISLDRNGCGDECVEHYYSCMTIREVTTKAERFLMRTK